MTAKPRVRAKPAPEKKPGERGAESPKETWLRLLLIDAGYPSPRTQIPVLDDRGIRIAVLDMGWDDTMVSVEYDGDQHRTDRRPYVKDIRRREELVELGWIVIQVIAEHPRDDILRRLRQAWDARTH